MKSTQMVLVVGLTLLLFSASEAAFDFTRAEELAEISLTTELLTGNPKNQRKFRQAVRDVVAKFGTCRPNVCFVLDGSGSITGRQWRLEKSFVTLAIATLGGLDGSKFAVAEYGAIVDPVATLQDATPGLLYDVIDEVQNDAPLTFVAPGIQWCRSQMELTPAVVNKIVLLGDGDSNFGDTGRFGAPRIAKAFRDASPANSICAGIVGGGHKQFFQDVTGNVSGKVLRPRNWDNIIDMIFALVELICEELP